MSRRPAAPMSRRPLSQRRRRGQSHRARRRPRARRHRARDAVRGRRPLRGQARRRRRGQRRGRLFCRRPRCGRLRGAVAPRRRRVALHADATARQRPLARQRSTSIAVGRWQYTVCAWVDPFLSWRHDFERRVDVDDLKRGGARRCRVDRAGRAACTRRARRQGAQGVGARAARRARRRRRPRRAEGDRAGPGAHNDRGASSRPAACADQRTAAADRRAAARAFFVVVRVLPALGVATTRIGTARSPTARPGCPMSQRLGFDVLYFPPIHPIGRERRKGRNNTLDAAPDDVGSPWAIGAREGGHDAILGELGTLEDFRRLVQQGRRARHRDRAGHRVPVRARPPVGARAPGMVPQARRRHRSSTPKTRPRNTRTSTRSTSRPRSGASCGTRWPA